MATVTNNSESIERAIKREDDEMQDRAKMIELQNVSADVDEDSLKALNLAHLTHPWLEQNLMFMALRNKLFTHFNRLEQIRQHQKQQTITTEVDSDKPPQSAPRLQFNVAKV